ncbi:tripartite tricarboxylate transporter permease [Hoeflea sp. CAU 1731]
MDFLSETFANIGFGLSVALQPANLWYCFVGVFLGTFVGVLPGIGALTAISLLFPLTFYMDPTAGLIMLAGVWYGTAYGGSIAAILINVPGTPSSAVTAIDGYPLAKKGRAGVALFITATSSFIGGSIGILLMMLFSPIIVDYALKFGSAEYFALMVLGLVAASTISGSSAAKNMAMILFGMAVGFVGLDIDTGDERFTFGIFALQDGIGLIPVVMGVFGLAEVIISVSNAGATKREDQAINLKSMWPKRDEFVRSLFPTLRGAGIGSFFGTLPGTGPTIASFMAYGVEKRFAKEPERLGHGAIEGIAAPEAANNAADQTAFIPTMTLGIPGSATMALMIGAMILHGITPGPSLMASHADVFWGLIMSFWIGNVLLLVLNVPLIGIWVRLLQVPYNMLFPAILVLLCVGLYIVDGSIVALWVVFAFGVIGVFMRVAGLPAASFLLGFVLGPMMEENFRRALTISGGDYLTFVERPLSAVILGIAFCLILFSGFSGLRHVVKL